MRLTLDFEVSTSNKGNPYDQTNKAVCLGLKVNDNTTNVLYDDFSSVQELLKETTLVIGFNWKFDGAWLRRLGYEYAGRLWDCQYAEFILRNQCNPYPSLSDCADSIVTGKPSSTKCQSCGTKESTPTKSTVRF